MSFKEIIIAVLFAVFFSFLYTSWRAHQTGASLIELEGRIELLEILKFDK
jgi:hypothetical protein